jgi:hypothetical protein
MNGDFMERYDLKKSLVGKTLRGFVHDGSSITFETDDGGRVEWETDADCCSRTWIEAVDLELCLGAAVTDVEEVDLPASWYEANPGPAEEDCLKTYGVTIRTTKGTGVIDFRNESNGYYGGSLVVRPTRQPGGSQNGT